MHKKTFCLDYNGKAIGSLGIEEYGKNFLPELALLEGREIGFVLSKEYWGQGLMSEAGNGVIKYLFEKKLDFILCGHYIWNSQSQRVQEKCGLRYYKQLKNKDFYGNDTIHVF